MNPADFAQLARSDQRFLDNIIAAIPPGSDDYAPFDGSLTVAQQVRHIAQTIHWFREGIFKGNFAMDFEAAERAMKEPCTLAQAREELAGAWDALVAAIEGSTAETLAAPIPPNPLFGEMARWQVLLGNTDHTAHHRGALSVYLRGLGVKPPMPYT